MNDESSTTATSRGPALSRRSSSDPPMLPPSADGRRAAPRMAAINDAVVDLPLLPVTPTTGPGQRSSSRPISLVMVTPASRAATTGGAVRRTAGLTTSRSTSVKSTSFVPAQSEIHAVGLELGQTVRPAPRGPA